MANNSSSCSSNSSSSTSSGEIESPISLLDEVEDAIFSTLNNQSYKLGDRVVTRANLLELKELREELKQETATIQNSRAVVATVDFRGNF